MICSVEPSFDCTNSAACLSRLTSVCVKNATLERTPAKASFPLSLTDNPAADKLKFQNIQIIRIKLSVFLIFIVKIGKILAFLCVKLDKKGISGYPNKNKEDPL